MLITGISEVLTLSTLYPFLTALTNPEKLLSNNIISFTYTYFKFTTPFQLLIPITITFGVEALLSSFFRLLTLWSNYRLSAKIGIDFSKKTFKNTIYQNYSTHLSRNSSEIISGVTTNITITITIITLILQMLAACFIVSSLLITLFFIDSVVASITILIISFSYLLIAKGYLINNFIKNGYPKSYGLDISEYAINSSPSEIVERLIKASVLKIPFPNNYFDFTLCLDVLQELSEDTIPTALREIQRVSKTSLVVVPTIKNKDQISKNNFLNWSISAKVAKTNEEWQKIFKNYDYQNSYSSFCLELDIVDD